jgi:hypothetical protein
MSDTPRTDDEEANQTQRYGCRMVKSHFARQLERELAETRKALEESMSHQRELRADRDRLDWLDSCGDVCSDLTGKCNWKEWLVSTINSSMKLDASIRSAIDSEMKLTKEENEN